MIDYGAERAVYRQVADILRDEIAASVYPPGGLLPSVLRIGQEHGVGRDTVRRALAVLVTEGLIVIERGYGARVVSEPVRQVVEVPGGARVRVRMATEADRDALGIPPGAVTAVIVVSIAGQDQARYRADRVELTGWR